MIQNTSGAAEAAKIPTALLSIAHSAEKHLGCLYFFQTGLVSIYRQSSEALQGTMLLKSWNELAETEAKFFFICLIFCTYSAKFYWNLLRHRKWKALSSTTTFCMYFSCTYICSFLFELLKILLLLAISGTDVVIILCHKQFWALAEESGLNSLTCLVFSIGSGKV